ncbi:MAG: DUF2807 domain-containing protein [Flavobacteriaceae bacterium]|nr:DUF2807 domain-containing protein [Flavobacteriaceae bacterium]MCB0474553.1 DUF2807 domain-containing protein [Flavobacteriaceae bacterium]
MKKLMLLAVMFGITMSVNAQWFNKKVKGNGKIVTITRNVDSYDQVAVAGSFNVELVAGTEGKLTVQMDENLLEYLVTEVEGSKLKIRWEKGINVYTKSKLLITVPFEDIYGVALAGSGDIIANDIIKGDSFGAALSGSGDMNLKVDVNSLKTAISGSGDIDVAGNSVTLDCAISGSGDFDGSKLNSKEVTVAIAGSGDASVGTVADLNVKIAGSGDVTYSGNPKKNVKISGSGSVRSR